MFAVSSDERLRQGQHALLVCSMLSMFTFITYGRMLVLAQLADLLSNTRNLGGSTPDLGTTIFNEEIRVFFYFIFESSEFNSP